MGKNDTGSDLKVVPAGDNRLRSSVSSELWVVNRSWSNNGQSLSVCGVLESIERTIYQLDGRGGRWVRYQNHYHQLHTIDEFLNILAEAKAGQFDFYNNNHHGQGNPITETEPAPFIYYDEPGPLVW